jgi:hypothetical protein
MVISPSKKIDWDVTFCAYLIISQDASLEPIFKVHNLLFVVVSYQLLKYTVHSCKHHACTPGADMRLRSTIRARTRTIYSRIHIRTY